MDTSILQKYCPSVSSQSAFQAMSGFLLFILLNRYLGNNSFGGTIPGSALSSLTNLKELYVGICAVCDFISVN